MNRLSLIPLGDATDSDKMATRVVRSNDLFDALRGALPEESVVRRDEPMSRRTTLRVGGPADIYLEPDCEDSLRTAIEFCRQLDIPWFVLGRGSNLLVRDGGIRGVVISLAQPKFSAIETLGERMFAGAGARLKQISNEARRAGIGGLEFLEGIPGSLGGALRMNAGAMGRWTFDVVERLRILTRDGEIKEVTSADAGAIYRECPILKNAIAIGAILRGDPAVPEDIRNRMDGYSRKRWESQPTQPSAGCTFKNPSATLPAGRLIDELGMKNWKVGGAMVSDVHANFLVNLGPGTAKDFLELIEVIRDRALSERGVDLHTEIEIIGEDLP
jgi:UDP-N-acetylenolpyruvoylglucosamine reductase